MDWLIEFVLCAFGPSFLIPVTLTGPVLVLAMAALQVPVLLLSMPIFSGSGLIGFRNYPGKENGIPSKQAVSGDVEKRE